MAYHRSIKKLELNWIPVLSQPLYANRYVYKIECNITLPNNNKLNNRKTRIEIKNKKTKTMKWNKHLQTDGNRTILTLCFGLNNIYLETWLYYIQFQYTITGLGNKLITYINPAPQDNCLQRTYSIKPCTLYNTKKYNESFFL